MKASVGARLTLRTQTESEILLSVAVAEGWARTERLEIHAEERGIPFDVVSDAHGTRLHRVTVPAGRIRIAYTAEVEAPERPALSDAADRFRYGRPSRYAPSDELAATAAAVFGSPTPAEAIARVPAWVGEHLSYVPGSSGPTDSAIHTLLQRRGVCRDYAHLTAGLMRALGVPARLVSVYAPGLSPMDFHAVVEAFVDGRWQVVDATRLAPRAHLVRIATGRDAADTAFLTTLSGGVALEEIEVVAVAEGDLRADDPTATVLLP